MDSIRASVHTAIQPTLEHFTKDPQNVPGLAFAAVDKNGKLLTFNASGKRSLGGKEPMDEDTIFWIASCTKIMTAIICMQLVEQGKIKLDDHKHLYQCCPELEKVKVLQADGSLVSKERDITLRMLLTHTAGFGYEFYNDKLNVHYRPVGINCFDGDVAEYVSQPLINQPGSRWEYGINIDWAGIYCERATGVRLNDLMMKNLIEPLGLKNTTMFPTPAMKKNLASFHQRWPGSQELHLQDHPLRSAFRDQSEEVQKTLMHSGGGGIFSKPTEYVQILATLLNDGTSPTTGARILKPETVKEMFTNQLPHMGQFGRNGLPAAKPEWSNPIPDLMPQKGNPDQGWGLSLMLALQKGDQGRSPGTGNWAGIGNLFYFVDREKGVAAMIASQILPFGDINVATAFGACEIALYKALGPDSKF